MFKKALFLACWLLGPALLADAFKVPQLSGPVVDQARILTEQVTFELDSILRAYQIQGRAQIQVLTVPSLNGLSIEEASLKVVDQWKLGTKKADNGVLILVAPQERKMRIEVGQGLEGDLPDAYARRITDQMTVLFKKGRYGDGIVTAVAEIIRRIDPTFDVSQLLTDGLPEKTRSKNDGLGALGFFLIIFIFIALSRGGGRRGGGGGTGFVTGLLLGSLTRGGGRSSGGGWSGGGGGFSGGGSSGNW